MRTFLILAVLAGLGWYGYRHTMANDAAAAEALADAGYDEFGFVEALSPEGAQEDVVLILRAENCPKEAAQRAAALGEELERMGVPYEFGHSMSFSNLEPTEENHRRVDAAVKVFNQGAPAVFINGWAAHDPSAEDVKAEYEATRG
jgi:hypothetical protein